MDPLIGRVLLDRYEVLERIGSGGMGSVYVARQRAVDRKVALKVLRTDLMTNEHVRERFRREAEIIARLRHPNTVQLYDFGESPEGLSVMVMELLVGSSLSQKLKDVGTLSVIETLRLGEQVAASLNEAHSLGLVHRDLKPANIFLVDVAGQDYAKVLDFGIARIMDEEATRLTSTGQVFGTPRYMSPEQATSTGDVDARSDIYSLGLILYECIVGQPPFVAQTSVQYLSQHSSEPPPKLRQSFKEAPEALEELIDACLEKLPESRPQTCAVVEKALGAIRRALEMGEPAPTSSFFRPKRSSEVAAPTHPVTLFPRDTAGAAQGSGGSGGLLRWGIIIGLFLVVAAGAVYWRLKSTERLVVQPLGDLPVVGRARSDAGSTATELAMGGLAAGSHTSTKSRSLSSDSVGEGAADAGGQLIAQAGGEAPDSGVDADGGAQKRAHKSRSHRRSKTTPTVFGADTFQGPRGIVINVGDESADLIRMAERCDKSALHGLSKLSTRRCPDGCAILVDALCAGKTPAQEVELAPGRKMVAVVCDGKVTRKRKIHFEEGKTGTFSCK